MSTYVIAEAGVNHNGSIDLAKQLVDIAVAAGADAVKFQTFRAESLVSRQAPKAAYQLETTFSGESQFDMIKRLELSEEAHDVLIQYCEAAGIQFLSTPFDPSSLRLLVERFQLPRIKLPSGEVTNAPLLLEAAQSGLPLILSTGMSTLDEVEAALGVLAFGYLGLAGPPSVMAFREAFDSEDGKRALRKQVTLLHCTTEYPTPFSDVNLRAMCTMRERFNLAVGFSDHTPGIVAPIAAAALGATVIEKHFTLDRSLPGPDHQASLEPGELTAMVSAIRQVEWAMGTGVKLPAESEKKNLATVRKSLIAARPVKKGEQFTSGNLTVKRPGTGASPFSYWDYLGKEASRDYAEDEVIE